MTEVEKISAKISDRIWDLAQAKTLLAEARAEMAGAVIEEAAARLRVPSSDKQAAAGGDDAPVYHGRAARQDIVGTLPPVITPPQH